MYASVISFFLLFFLCVPSPAQSTDAHLLESGTSTVFYRSAFAHGYRHGYEQGYHSGNMAANMGHTLADSSGASHGVSDGYRGEFGSRKSFAEGFEMGLKAGYNDGYLGRSFRAVSDFQALAAGITRSFPAADPHSAYFDQGFAAGYKNALRLPPAAPSVASVTPAAGSCGEFHPRKPEDAGAQGSFCEGYRRGLMLGTDDAAFSLPSARSLQARR